MTEPRNPLEMTLSQFAAATASKSPTPGGGSVAGTVGALAVALGEMSLAFTRGKKAFAEHEDDFVRIAARLERARGMFLDLIDDDISAYGMYAEAMAQPAGPQRDEAAALALAASINVPRETGKLALCVARDLASLAERCNRFLLSDLVAAATLLSAVTVLCDLNVRINAKDLTDTDAARELRDASRQDRVATTELAEQIETVASRTLD